MPTVKLLDRDDLLYWTLINFITSTPALHEKLMNKEFEGGKVELTITMNGVEVDPELFFNRVRVGIDQRVEYKAREIVESHLGDLIEELDEIETLLREKVTQVVRKTLEENPISGI